MSSRSSTPAGRSPKPLHRALGKLKAALDELQAGIAEYTGFDDARDLLQAERQTKGAGLLVRDVLDRNREGA